MKHLTIITGLLLVSILTQAQVTPKPVRADIKTPQATCEACKTKIESLVSKNVDGIVKVSVRISSGVTSVQFYPDRTNIDVIRYIISNAGFDADEVLANPDFYERLPDCCKKPQDRKTAPVPKKQ